MVMTTHHPHHQTVMELVGAQCLADLNISSLPEALGLAQIQLHSLASELSLSAGQQDAERLMQSLVSLAAVAVEAAAGLVLPTIEKEDA
jgi:hypothetical protein